MYSNEFVEIFINNPNVGDLKGATVKSTLKSKLQGDVISLYLKINNNFIIENAKYKAFGGVATSVIASKLCDMISNKSIIFAKKITTNELLNEINAFPKQKEYLAQLALAVLADCVKKYLRRHKLNL